MKSFQYCGVRTLEEAFSLLAQHQGKAKVLAGGTDLLGEMKKETVCPEYLVDIKSIPGLDAIRYHKNEGLKIGALATIRALETSTLIKDKFSVLAQAAHEIGSVQIRNQATIGGNLCHASPSADTAPALLCLDARVTTRGLAGVRSIPLKDFFQGPGETSLQPGEVLTEIEIPWSPAHTAGLYLKLRRIKSMDLAIVGVAVVLTVDPADGICGDIKIALGAVAPTPIRAHGAERIIRGKKIHDDLIAEVAQAASEEVRPISDVRASAEYRKEMVKVLTGRALRQAYELVGSD